MSGLLYFPSISIPQTSWLIQSLLYWDEVASIVPLDYVEHPEWHSPTMRSLVQSELVTQVFPEHHIWELRDFEDTFVEYLKNDHETQSTMKALRAGNQPKYTDLHIGKLGTLSTELAKMGLGFRDTYGPWMNVESNVAEKFMTYLALVLGQRTDLQPATDRPTGLRHIAGTRRRGMSEPDSTSLHSLRQEVLSEILPVPAEIPDVWDLVRFKEEFGEDLVRFRLRVERFLLELEAAPVQQRASRKRIFYSEMREERLAIERALSERRWAPVFMSLVSVASGALSFSDSLAAGSTQAKVASGLALLAAVGTAITSGRETAPLKNNPMAYAVHVKRRWSSAGLRQVAYWACDEGDKC